MDPTDARLVEIGLYTMGALATTFTVSGFYFVMKYRTEVAKADFETRAERTRALKDLMDSEGFRDYTQKRKEAMENLLKNENVSPYEAEELIDSALGNFKPERI